MADVGYARRAGSIGQSAARVNVRTVVGAGQAVSSGKLANHEIVTFAVYLLGGDSQYVDTEDVAVKANEIAPGRFTWRKYPGQINIETVRKRLWDAMKPEKGGLLEGSERRGWVLTDKGLAYVREHLPQLKAYDLSGQRLSVGEARWRERQRLRLLSSNAYAKYRNGEVHSVTKQDLEAFFMVDDYVDGVARRRRVLRICRAFESDPDLGQAVRTLRALLNGGGESDVG